MNNKLTPLKHIWDDSRIITFGEIKCLHTSNSAINSVWKDVRSSVEHAIRDITEPSLYLPTYKRIYREKQ